MEVLKRYCVDSDVLIDYLCGFEPARSFLLKSGAEALLNVSVVSIAEIYAGKETASAIKRLLIDRFLSNFYVIGVDAQIAKVAGIIRRDYNKPFADAIIAAASLAYDLRLVTKNVRHFKEIKGLNNIKSLLSHENH